MKEQGFVYVGTLSKEEVTSLLGRMSVAVHFAWDLAHLDAGEGIPGDLRDRGVAFNERCEVRWQRIGEEDFRVWVLSDEPQKDLPLPIAEGEWTTEVQETRLWNLEEKAIHPPFDRYPALDAPVGKLRCRIFYRDGVAMFVSPREVLPDERQAISN